MIVLGIETSCDETGIGIYSEQGLLSATLYSQIILHREYGGVVPELASRDHIRKILPLITQALKKAGIKKSQLGGIAYTMGPGLVGALLVGAAVGRSLAWALDIPAMGVHHMEGHLLAPMLETKQPPFPFVALLVSGGHTQLYDVKGIGQYQLLGESLDDAAGEAFDKTAKLLGLPYPGGPELAKIAEQGDPDRFHFPRPMTNKAGCDFSFSGLKTFALNCMQQHQPLNTQDKADIARAFEDAVVDTLLIKCRRALKQTHCQTLVLAGGVSANQRLRNKLQNYMTKNKGQIFYPRPEFCTDNGAMIAFAGWQRLQAGQETELSFNAIARWNMTDLPAISE